MTISLIAFFINVIAAFTAARTGRMIWCGIDITVAVLMALVAICGEGRLLNRIKSLEQEVDILKRRM